MTYRGNNYNRRNTDSQLWKCTTTPVRLTFMLALGFSLCQVVSAAVTCPPLSAINNDNKSLPNMTGSYTAFMEIWDTSTQTFSFREEYVDQETNMAAIRIYGLYDPGDVYVFVSDFNSRQLFTVSGDKHGERHCRATAIVPHESDSFPAVLVANNSREHIASTHTLLDFGKKFHEQYKGSSNVRGKPADLWTGCDVDKDMKTTIITDYYFSVPGWFPSSSDTVVPLRCIITTEIPTTSVTPDLKVKTQIDYVYFSHQVTEKSIFETASGIYCEGRQPINSKPVPDMPDTFSFRSQLVLPNQQEISVHNEVYDLPNKLAMVETTSAPVGPRAQIDDRSNRRTSVMDFNYGISYLISSEVGHCDIAPITPDSINTRQASTDSIRMATAQEFYRFDSGNFVYTGQAKIAGVDCDTWTGQTNNYPDGLNATSYWTWYFNAPTWSVASSQRPQVPIYLDIKIPLTGLEYQYSIQDFQSTAPDWADVDIMDCYQNKETRNIQFNVIGNFGVAKSRPKLFRQQIIQKLADVMQVTRLRIAQFQSHLEEAPPSVAFTLLDFPGVKGDVSSLSPLIKTTLDQAVQRLNDTIAEGLVFLRFYIRNPQNREQVVPIYAAPSSLRQTIHHPNGTISHIPPLVPTQSACPTVTTSLSPSPSRPSTTSTAPSLSSSSSPKSGTSTLSTTDDGPPRVTFLGGVTRAPSQVNPSTAKSGLCKNDHEDSSTWSAKNIAGVCIGACVLGLLVGVIGLGTVQGWARPCLKRRTDKGNSNSYSMMSSIS